jgi:hypothetical protein
MLDTECLPASTHCVVRPRASSESASSRQLRSVRVRLRPSTTELPVFLRPRVDMTPVLFLGPFFPCLSFSLIARYVMRSLTLLLPLLPIHGLPPLLSLPHLLAIQIQRCPHRRIHGSHGPHGRPPHPSLPNCHRQPPPAYHDPPPYHGHAGHGQASRPRKQGSFWRRVDGRWLNGREDEGKDDPPQKKRIDSSVL